MAIPTAAPAFFTAGDTVKFTKNLSEYLPADGWVLTYDFVQAGKHQSATATDNGDGKHLLTIAASSTANFSAGPYHYQAFVTNGAERYTVEQGQIEVKPNFAALTSGYDARSIVKRTLDALEATLEGKAGNDSQSATINGRSISTYPPADLIKWHSHYTLLYKQELNKSGVESGKQTTNFIKTRF